MESILFFKEASPLFFYGLILATGLSIGSFLNVLIYRLPLIIDEECTVEVKYYLRLKLIKHDEIQVGDNKFATLGGRSYCPNCQQMVPGWFNLPVLGWFFLRGKTKCCSNKLSFRYPLIEFLAGFITVTSFLNFEVIQAAYISLAFYILISLAMIDKDKMLLPDVLVFPLLWIGVFSNINGTFIELESSIYGVLAGYLSMTIIPVVYGFITGRKGLKMGQGDVKLMAAAGAWLGPSMLPIIFLMGAVITILLLVIFRDKFYVNNELLSDKPIMPFGPGLCLGFFTCLWAQDLIVNKLY